MKPTDVFTPGQIRTLQGGYRRPPQMAANLIAALSAALYEHPEQRLGQLLVNLSRDGDLFTIYDEGLLDALREAADNGADGEPAWNTITLEIEAMGDRSALRRVVEHAADGLMVKLLATPEVIDPSWLLTVHTGGEA